MNTSSAHPIIEVADQLEFLLEYLQQAESGRSTPGEEINYFPSQDDQYSVYNYEESSQPLDLSMKRTESRAKSEPQRPLSTSSSTSTISNCSTSSNNSMAESCLLDFDFDFLPSPGPSSPGSPIVYNQDKKYVILEQCHSTPNFSITPLLSCSNCFTTTTSTWRKDSMGSPVCNACGVYFRVHQKKRPAEWAREPITRRKRNKRS